tara:strand:- start:121 stop:459 length:339 start_codon:yes stop_codon:yes gene_type:complete
LISYLGKSKFGLETLPIVFKAAFKEGSPTSNFQFVGVGVGELKAKEFTPKHYFWNLISLAICDKREKETGPPLTTLPRTTYNPAPPPYGRFFEPPQNSGRVFERRESMVKGD